MNYLPSPNRSITNGTAYVPSETFDSPLRQMLLYAALTTFGFAGLVVLLYSQYGYLVAYAVVLFALYKALSSKGRSSTSTTVIVPVESEPQTVIHHHHYNLHYHADQSKTSKNTGYVRSEEIRND